MANVKLGTKAVGSVLKLNLNGSPKNFIVVHQGKPSSLYDDSCDGTWVLMQDIHSTRQWDGSNNDYKNSDIHSWLNGTFLNLFDANIRDAIKQVKIPYHNGTGSSGSVASGANGLSCKIFLLSGYELGWTKSDNSYFPQDGAKLDYFTAGTGSAANKKRIAKYNGSATDWWTRSPVTGSSNNVWIVGSVGDCDDWYYYNTYGVRPAFVLPSTLSVSDDGTVSTNAAPTVTSESGASGVNLGEKNAAFSFSYTPSDEDGDSLTVTEKLDGVTTKTRNSVTSGTVLTFEAASTAAEFQKILNGQHTITIEVSDGTETAAFTATFTKAVHAATITLETPMAVEGDITVARLAVTGNIPADAEYSVKVTNNGNDTEPVWQDCTAEVKSGANIVFENHENTNGAAFNFKIEAERGSSDAAGYITGVSGAFQ